jgi:RimJ/RimL family protein N-acetyltransferase
MSTRHRNARRAEVTFRPTTREDLPELISLWNDGRVMKWVGFPNGLGYDEAKIHRWFDRTAQSPLRRHFVARSPDVGFCGELYYHLDPPHRRTGLDIKFRPEAQGGGRSLAALSGLIRHVFEASTPVQPARTTTASARFMSPANARPRGPVSATAGVSGRSRKSAASTGS